MYKKPYRDLNTYFRNQFGGRVHKVTVDAGLKVSFGGEALVHDFSSDSVSDMICAYLNPRVLEIIRREG